MSVVAHKETLRLEVLKIVSVRPVQSMEQMVNMAKVLEAYVIGENTMLSLPDPDVAPKKGGVKSKTGNPDILS